MSEVIATPFRAMASLPPSPFPVSPSNHEIRALASAPTEMVSVLSGVRAAERSERVSVEELGGGIDLVDLAYHQPAGETIVRQVGDGLSEQVRRAHEAQVQALKEKVEVEEVLKDEFTVELGWNPQTGAMDAMMDGRVMGALRQMGPVVVIKGRVHF